MASFLSLLADGKDGAEAVAGGHIVRSLSVNFGPFRYRPDKSAKFGMVTLKDLRKHI